MRFLPGQTALRQCWRGGKITFLQATRVIEDAERGLLLFQPAGGTHWRIMAADGRTHHDGTVDELGEDARLVPLAWTGHDVLHWQRPGEPWSVWFFFRHGEFRGWYGKDPVRRTSIRGPARSPVRDRWSRPRHVPRRRATASRLPVPRARTSAPRRRRPAHR
jgi:hypothetical protein